MHFQSKIHKNLQIFNKTILVKKTTETHKTKRKILNRKISSLNTEINNLKKTIEN